MGEEEEEQQVRRRNAWETMHPVAGSSAVLWIWLPTTK